VDRAPAAVQRLLDGGRVVGFAIAFGSEITNTHGTGGDLADSHGDTPESDGKKNCGTKQHG
jgi:hypothetical protein